MLGLAMFVVHMVHLSADSADIESRTVFLSGSSGRASLKVLAVSGFLMCWAVVWALMDWRRRVVKPLRELTWQLSQEPENADAYVDRALVYLNRTPLVDHGIADLTKAIELEPDAWELYDLRADASRLLPNYEQAILDRTRAIAILAETGELAAEHWWLYASRGLDHELAADDDRAIADFTEAIRLLAEDEEAERVEKAILFYWRAMAHQRCGDRESAKRDFSEAHRHDRLRRYDPRSWWQAMKVLPYAILIWGLLYSLIWVFAE